TGLRVGLACAKGLAYAAQLPVAGVSSLAAVALLGPLDRLLFPLAVSRKGELYLGLYRHHGDRVVLEGVEEAVSIKVVGQRLMAHPDAWALGRAVAAHGSELESLGVPSSALQDGPAYPPARALVELAMLPAAYDFRSLAALEPNYIGLSGAERQAK